MIKNREIWKSLDKRVTMSLTERLHGLLVKIRKSIDVDLPDPAVLSFADELNIKGHMVTVRSSAPISDLAREENLTVYIHAKPDEANPMEPGFEMVRYFHYDGRRDLSNIYIMLTSRDGNIRQDVRMSSLPREIAMSIIDRHLGRGEPRPRKPRRGGAGRGPPGGGGRGGGRFGGRGGRGERPPPMEVEEESD